MRLLPAVLLASIASFCAFGQDYVITTVAGNGTAGFTGDNGPAIKAQLNAPKGIAVDSAGVGQDGSMSGNGQFWVMNATPTILHQIAANGSADAKYWFSTTDSSGNLLFSQPAKNTFNTQPAGFRNVIHNPGFENWNVGLFKKFSFTEKTGMQFRAEAFNVLNHPNWGGASFNPTNLSTFGKITSKTGDVRNIQLSLRLFF